MTQFEGNEIFARLEKLERENRSLKRIGALVILVAGAGMLMAQAPARPRTLEAEKLIIRYPNGKEAIVLDTSKSTLEESARASFYRPAGSLGASVTAGAFASDFSAFSPNSDFEIAMSGNNKFANPPDMKRPTGSGAGLMILRLNQTGGAQRVLYDLSSNNTGDTYQFMHNESGQSLGLEAGPDGVNMQLSEKEHSRAVLGSTKLQTTRTGSIESLPPSSLTLFDKDGNVLWRAP